MSTCTYTHFVKAFALGSVSLKLSMNVNTGVDLLVVVKGLHQIQIHVQNIEKKIF